MANLTNKEYLNLPLDTILLERGYTLKRDKCSKHSTTLFNDKELLIITRQSNGNYLYFNPNEEKDRGNIFSYCKNRGIKVSTLLESKNLEELQSNHILNTNIPFKDEKITEIIKDFQTFKEISLNNFFHTQRLIDNEILKRFSLKNDKLGNICIPTYYLKHRSEVLENNFVFIHQGGYMSYLRKPFLREKSLKPTKQLCYGIKGLEILIPQNTNPSEIQNILLTESSIDSLSLLELRDLGEKTLLCSTNGQITRTQQEILEVFAKDVKLKNAQFILGFDNDTKGESFKDKVLEILKNKEVLIQKPLLKDFNDDLMVAKILRLSKDFTLKDLQEKIQKDFLNPLDDFLLKKGVLYEEALQRKFTEVRNIQYVLEFLTPKFENFIETKAITQRLSKLSCYKKTQTHTPSLN